MLKIVLYPKIKYKLKITFWSTFFYILPSYKFIKKTYSNSKYCFMWLTIGIVIEEPNN